MNNSRRRQQSHNRGQRTGSPKRTIGTKPEGSSNLRSGRINEDNRPAQPRGYRIDYGKLKALCHQAGLQILDLYEPGAFPRRLISEGTLKKLRRGCPVTIATLSKIAAGLNQKLGCKVDWREVVQATPIDAPVDRRLAVAPFHTAAGDHVSNDVVAGFRAMIITQLSKVAGLKVIVAAPCDVANPSEPDTVVIDTVLSGTLRVHGDVGRLDLELTDAKAHELVWAYAYPFNLADLLTAQTAIAADVAHQVGRALSS